MSSELPSELRAELLDDFYSECDEHLNAIREGLVRLESSVDRAQPDPMVLEKLFRSFHSIKGNAAIVGLRTAENLSHSAEDFLRGLTRNDVTLSAAALELLMSVTQRLEQIIAAHRAGNPALPESEQLMKQLRRAKGSPESDAPAELAASKPAPVLQPDLKNQIDEARAQGLTIWQFTFTPAAALDQRGININSVRSRIAALGDILAAKPIVHGAGSITFEFLAALRETPVEFSDWETAGISLQLFEHGPDSSDQEQDATAPAGVDASQGPFVAPSHIVRVDLSRLDDLMRIAGELVIHRARLEDRLGRLAASGGDGEMQGLNETSVALGRSLRELRESIMRVRLVPVAEIFSRMPFVVRDLARETGRKVRLTLEGQQTEIDKYLVERLKDPLLHLVRNSVSHGIEEEHERLAAGKPAEATIFLRASTIGDAVVLEMGDDGRGINVQAVMNRAAERGLPVPPVVNDASLLQLICLPGFSTRNEADRAAGRGVGMSVVSNTVRTLGGTLALENSPGRGIRFALRLPLTLAISDVFIVSANRHVCAVPQSFVDEVLPFRPQTVRRINETEVIPYRDGILPLIRLHQMFGAESESQSSLTVLVLSSETGSTGLVVDRIHGQREVVVRSIRDPLVQVPGISGATELGDGRPVLILDVVGLTSGIVRPPSLENAARTGPTPLAIAI
jgi:two-component system chemotaxis sensor kinase CheA